MRDQRSTLPLQKALAAWRSIINPFLLKNEPSMFPYSKYHALGNDYLVIEPSGLPAPLSPAAIRAICQRNTGLGSDGILLGPLTTAPGQFWAAHF